MAIASAEPKLTPDFTTCIERPIVLCLGGAESMIGPLWVIGSPWLRDSRLCVRPNQQRRYRSPFTVHCSPFTVHQAFIVHQRYGAIADASHLAKAALVI